MSTMDCICPRTGRNGVWFFNYLLPGVEIPDTSWESREFEELVPESVGS